MLDLEPIDAILILIIVMITHRVYAAWTHAWPSPWSFAWPSPCELLCNINICNGDMVHYLQTATGVNRTQQQENIRHFDDLKYFVFVLRPNNKTLHLK